jgi:hypothetical protein
MVRFATQHVDRAAGLIAVTRLVVEERSGAGLCDPPTGLILVEGALERPQQQIALGAIGIAHPEARIRFTVGRLYRRADLGDIGSLAAKDEKLTDLNIGFEEARIFYETPRRAKPIFKVVPRDNQDENGASIKVRIAVGL